MLQVFFNRVVVLLPSVERLLAQKTHDIVGALRVRLEVESGLSELEKTRQYGLLLALQALHVPQLETASDVASEGLLVRATQRSMLSPSKQAEGRGTRRDDSQRRSNGHRRPS
jgi:hypothetical protein